MQKKFVLQVLLPRLSYFPLVVDKMCRHNQIAAGQNDADEMWMEYQGQPLKWLSISGNYL